MKGSFTVRKACIKSHLRYEKQTALKELAASLIWVDCCDQREAKSRLCLAGNLAVIFFTINASSVAITGNGYSLQGRIETIVILRSLLTWISFYKYTLLIGIS